MRRLILSLCLVVILLASICLTSCDDSGGGSKVNLSLVTGNAGGSNYTAGVAIADIMNKFVNIDDLDDVGSLYVTPEASLGTYANVDLMNKGQAELAWLSSYDAYVFSHGLDDRVPGKNEFSVLLPALTSWFHYMVRSNSSYYTFKDLIGSGAKWWKWDLVSSASAITVEQWKAITREYGVTADDLTSMPIFTLNDLAQGMKDGTIDFMSYPASIGTAGMIELTNDVGVRFFNIDDEKMASILAEQPYFISTTAPAGTYNGMDTPINMLGYANFVVVKNSLDEDLVYELAKAVYEHHEELLAIAANLGEISIDNISWNTVAPWHPGVVKYFKEKGIWTSEMEALQNKLLAETSD